MKSLIQFFEESVEKFSNNVYLWEKPNEKYEGTTLLLVLFQLE
jgi:long-chain acyl-CoA synthetase